MMTCARGLAVAGVLGLTAVLLPAGRAQVGPGSLPHGRQVVLAMKNGKMVEGTVVRTEAGAVYLRKRAGQLPQRVPLADVKKVAPKNPKGKPRPEIHQVEILNGSERTVKYVAPTLSPVERARLAELEVAENDVARAEALGGDRELEASRRQAHINFYKYSAASSLGFFPATSITNLAYNPPAYFGYGSPYGWPYSYGLYGYGLGYGAPYAYSSLGGLMTIPAVSPALAGNYEGGARMSAKEAAQARAAARANLARARSWAVYERGRLVAVRPEDGTEKGPAMPPAK